VAGASASGDKVVLRPFRRTDPRTLKDTNFNVGDPFTDALEDYHESEDGPDGHGPLVGDKPTEENKSTPAVKKAADSAPADSSKQGDK
jgi:hypothetical protein